MWVRALCTQRRVGAPRALKQHLNRLYQVVHPDRFAGDAHARAVNERSFQQLQSALDDHFASSTPPAKSSASTLVFFAHGESPGALRKASVRVGGGRGSLAAALGSLFDQLSLTPPPADALGGALDADPPPPQFDSLSALACAARSQAAAAAMRHQKRAAEEAAEAAAAHSDAEVLRLALQRAHGIVVEVDAGLPRDGRLDALVARLRDALMDAARAGVELRGGRLTVDGGFDAGVVLEGDGADVVLGACAGRRQWDEALGDEELVERCRVRRMHERQTRELEYAAARVLGVRLVMHDVPVGMQADYRILLSELTDAAGDEDASSAAGRTEVVVMLVPGDETSADAREGVLRIGVQLGSDGVRKAILAEAQELAARYAALVAKEKAFDRERAAIRRALRVDDVRRSDGVGDRQWATCVASMRERAEKMRRVLHGTSVVVVDDEAGVEDGEIRLPWDFATRLNV